MNPTERLKAAIAKLEALKAASQGDHWYRSIGGISAYGGVFGASPEGIAHIRDGERSAYTPQMTSVDADLIVTLHRTIDAQLRILRRAANYIPGFFEAMVGAHGGIDLEPGPYYQRPEAAWDNIRHQFSAQLELADAILGES